jgi:15-cis-phytoene synthase
LTITAVADAHLECRRIARASGSSFYAGIRILPPERRDGLFAVYALARRIDDVADGATETSVKLAQLSRIRAELAHLGESADPVLLAVADTVARYPVPLVAFEDLIDGAEDDVRGTTYESFTDLERYCRRVAGSIGRLALGLFETSDRAAAEPLADDLGVALQLGNILRDLTDDLRDGRSYLPAEDLARFGCAVEHGRIAGDAELVVAFEAQRALGWLERGLGLIPLIDRRSGASVLAMSASYRRILERIATEPSLVLRTRPSLRGWEKGWVLTRSLIGGLA